MYRGYYIVETKKCKYLYAHLHPKETDRAKAIRKEQINEVLELTKNRSKPWVFAGDLNIDQNKAEYKNLKGFKDTLDKETMTCEENGKQESVDYIVTHTDEERLNIKTEVYTNLKLSDHSTLIATISLVKK